MLFSFLQDLVSLQTEAQKVLDSMAVLTYVEPLRRIE